MKISFRLVCFCLLFERAGKISGAGARDDFRSYRTRKTLRRPIGRKITPSRPSSASDPSRVLSPVMLKWRRTRRWSHSPTCVPKLFWGPADRSHPFGGMKSGLEAPGANALSSPASGDHRHMKVSPLVKSYSTRRSSQVCLCRSHSRHSSWRLPKTFAQRIAKKKTKENWNGGLKISVFYSAKARNRKIEDDGFDDYIRISTTYELWRPWQHWICALLV